MSDAPIQELLPFLKKGAARKVYSVEEHGAVDISLSEMLLDGKLDLYPEIRSGDFVKVFLRKGAISFQATGKVGHIPLNSRVALYVTPRVPIGNLERVLRIADYAPEYLLSFARNYASHEDPARHLLDALAEGFVFNVERLIKLGIRQEYRPIVEVNSLPRGRILFSASMRLAATNRPHQLATEVFTYLPDTEANRCLKWTLFTLAAGYRSREGEGLLKLRKRINQAFRYFERVALDSSLAFLKSDVINETSRLTAESYHYAPAINLARVLLKRKGVAFTKIGSEFQMGCMFLDLAEVFEAYLRRVLESGIDPSALTCLDGNVGGLRGGKKPYYIAVPVPFQDTPATPDMVLCLPKLKAPLDGVRAVLDAKYKPLTAPERPDVNQVVAYAVTYGTNNAVIVRPRVTGKNAGLRFLGRIANIDVYDYAYDLNAPDLEAEEQSFCFSMATLP